MSSALELPEHIEPLDKTKHKELRFTRLQDFHFAKNISSVPVAFSEMQQISRYYPIVLPADGTTTPTALLSLQADANQYINEQGKWKVPCIPLCIRLYPFLLAQGQNRETKEARQILCLDRQAEHFASSQGDPLFTADGEPAEFVQAISKTLAMYHRELAETRNLFEALDKKGVIADRSYVFNVKGQKQTMEGYKGVDMEKLLALDDKTLADLVRNGTMPLVYCHLQSLSRFTFIA